MKPQSRRIIHVGINFLTIPPPIISPQTALVFQQAILNQGLEYQDVRLPPNQIILLRETPSPLQVNIGLSPDLQIGQILIVGENIKASVGLELFIQETEAVMNAFQNIWSSPNSQIIRNDSTIRELYETTSQHAFQELWEQRLGQTSQALATFGRPIRGGGLRFVMDPLLDDKDPAQIEVKVESFLADTSKIFVETQFNWTTPSRQQGQFNARERLEQMNEYIEKHIISFISGEKGSDNR